MEVVMTQTSNQQFKEAKSKMRRKTTRTKIMAQFRSGFARNLQIDPKLSLK